VGPNLSAPPARRTRSTRSLLRRRVGASLSVLTCLVLLSGCSTATIDQWKRMGLPESASESAPKMEALWVGAWIAAWIVGFLVWGLIIWAMIRYRRRADDEIPTQVRYNLPIEVLYTVAPFVIIFVLFYHTVVTQEEMIPDDQPGQEEIIVVGQQWSWTFNYLGQNGQDDPGAADADDVFTVGTPAEDPTLYLPVNTPVKFRLRSPDVIHSFWVPAFYFKMDVIPGRENSWITTPTREGTYAGKCAELCGLEHSRMLFNVRVVSQAEYQQHLQSLRAEGNTGVALGGTESDEIAGLEPENGNGAPE